MIINNSLPKVLIKSIYIELNKFFVFKEIDVKHATPNYFLWVEAEFHTNKK